MNKRPDHQDSWQVWPAPPFFVLQCCLLYVARDASGGVHFGHGHSLGYGVVQILLAAILVSGLFLFCQRFLKTHRRGVLGYAADSAPAVLLAAAVFLTYQTARGAGFLSPDFLSRLSPSAIIQWGAIDATGLLNFLIGWGAVLVASLGVYALARSASGQLSAMPRRALLGSYVAAACAVGLGAIVGELNADSRSAVEPEISVYWLDPASSHVTMEVGSETASPALGSPGAPGTLLSVNIREEIATGRARFVAVFTGFEKVESSAHEVSFHEHFQDPGGELECLGGQLYAYIVRGSASGSAGVSVQAQLSRELESGAVDAKIVSLPRLRSLECDSQIDPGGGEPVLSRQHPVSIAFLNDDDSEIVTNPNWPSPVQPSAGVPVALRWEGDGDLAVRYISSSPSDRNRGTLLLLVAGVLGGVIGTLLIERALASGGANVTTPDHRLSRPVRDESPPALVGRLTSRRRLGRPRRVATMSLVAVFSAAISRVVLRRRAYKSTDRESRRAIFARVRGRE